MKNKVKNSGWFLFIVGSIYIVTAFFSMGYHHYDEHYQILEFANYKLGLTAVDDLAWEFKAQIRSSIQPIIALHIFKLLIICGIRDRFIWALSLRLLTALLTFVTIKKFVDAFLSEITASGAPYFIFLSYLLWFLPYINVRYSSETWSGLFFLIVLTLIKSNTSKHYASRYLFIGLAMGLAILFRYQAVLLVGGSLLWLCIINQTSFKNIAITIGAIAMVLIFGILLDSWFYGEWVITIINYFKANIVEDKASTYGVLPWYQYAVYIINAPIVFFGWVILFSVFAVIYKGGKNLLVWSLLPFFIVHSIIPHKELRFLFQVANLAPIIIITAWDKVWSNYCKGYLMVGKYALVTLFIINTGALVCTSIKSAGDGRLTIAQYIQNQYPNRQITLLLDPGANPYDVIPPRDIFYKNYNVRLIPISLTDIPDILKYKNSDNVNLLAIYKDDASTPFVSYWIKKHKLKPVKESIPYVSILGLSFYDSSLAKKNIILFEFN